MKKILTTLGALIITAAPLATISCGADPVFNDDVNTIFVESENIIEKIHDYKIAISSDENGDFLIIPLDNSVDKDTLFEGPIQLSVDYWNFSPTNSDVIEHLSELEVTKAMLDNEVSESSKTLKLSIEHLNNYESKESKLKENIINAITEIDQKLDEYIVGGLTSSEFEDSMVTITSNYNILDSYIMVDGKNVFNPRWEMHWYSKIYGDKHEESIDNVDISRTMEIIYNMLLPNALRAIIISELL